MDPRRPVIPIAVEEDEDHLVLHRDGTVREAAKVILAPEDVGRMRAGYVCAICMEVQDKPFPDQCWVCKFPMGSKQTEYLAKAYQGRTRMGPSTSMEDELAALEELEERERFEAAGITRPSILIPRTW